MRKLSEKNFSYVNPDKIYVFILGGSVYKAQAMLSETQGFSFASLNHTHCFASGVWDNIYDMILDAVHICKKQNGKVYELNNIIDLFKVL